MIENYIRPAYQKLLVDPIALQLHNHTRFSPTGLTITSVIFGMFCLCLLMMHESEWAILFLLVSGYLDTIDGTLARVKKINSTKGAVLDIVADRIVEFLVIFGLFYLDPIARASAALWMLGSSYLCVTSFLVVGIFTKNKGKKSFHYSVGLMERAEAFLFFILMILIPAWFIPLAWCYTTLVLITAIQRVYLFLKFEWA